MVISIELVEQLRKLKEEHRLLDETILQLMEESPYNQIAVQKFKKKKLYLKDKILTIETKIIPNIIA